MDEVEAQALVSKTALAGAVAAISAASPELGIAAGAALPALDVAVERGKQSAQREQYERWRPQQPKRT